MKENENKEFDKNEYQKDAKQEAQATKGTNKAIGIVVISLIVIALIVVLCYNSLNTSKTETKTTVYDTTWVKVQANCPLVGWGMYWYKKFPNKDNELVQQKAEKEIEKKFGDGKKDIRNLLVNVPVKFNEVISPVEKDGAKEKLYLVSFFGDPNYGEPLYYAIDCVVDAKTAESLDPNYETYYLTMIEKCGYNFSKGYSFNGKGYGVGSGNVYLGSFIGGLAKVTKEPQETKKMVVTKRQSY